MLGFIVLVGALTLAAICFAFLLAGIISKPIGRVNAMLEDISEGEGDLTRQLTANTTEEIGILARLFNLFVSKIKKVVIEVKDSSAAILNYTDEIHDAIDQANDGIEHINLEVQKMIDGLQSSASVVQETTASIEELSSSAQMIANEASAVSEDSHQVLTASKQGVDKLTRVVDSIEQVKTSSDAMASMIATLKSSSDEIVTIVTIIHIDDFIFIQFDCPTFCTENRPVFNPRLSRSPIKLPSILVILI